MQYLTTLSNDINFTTGVAMANLFLNSFLLSPFSPFKTLWNTGCMYISYMLSPNLSISTAATQCLQLSQVFPQWQK